MAETGSGAAKGSLGLIAGAILGAGVALLYAPQAGARTRREIRYYSRRAGRKARRIARDVSDSVSGMVDRLEGNAMSVVEKGRNYADGAKREVLVAIEEGRERFRHRREQPDIRSVESPASELPPDARAEGR